jgi:hypothetical protein
MHFQVASMYVLLGKYTSNVMKPTFKSKNNTTHFIVYSFICLTYLTRKILPSNLQAYMLKVAHHLWLVAWVCQIVHAQTIVYHFKPLT